MTNQNQDKDKSGQQQGDNQKQGGQQQGNQPGRRDQQQGGGADAGRPDESGLTRGEDETK